MSGTAVVQRSEGSKASESKRDRERERMNARQSERTRGWLEGGGRE